MAELQKRGVSSLNGGDVKMGLCRTAKSLALWSQAEKLGVYGDKSGCQTLPAAYPSEFVRRWPDEMPTSVAGGMLTIVRGDDSGQG